MFVRVAALAIASAAGVTGCGGGGDGESDATISLAATAQGASEIALAWSAPPTLLNYYAVYRDGAPVIPNVPGGTAVTDDNLAPGTRYCYQVFAFLFPLGRVASSNIACATTGPTAGWPLASVAAISTSGGYASLALDAAGYAHVSYRSPAGVAYATNSPAGTWSSETVDAAAGAMGGTGIALDAAGKAHLSYYDAANARLLYATNTSGAWVIEEAAASGGFANSIVVDAAGAVAIAFAGTTPSDILWYVTRTGGTWSGPAFIAGYGDRIRPVSLARDTSGSARIAYAVGSGVCAIGYAAQAGAAWNDEAIDASANCGASLALGTGDAPYVAYVKSLDLLVADKSSGNWASATADHMSWVGGADVSIAADAAGRMHVGYQDRNADLKYATNASGAWAASTVDAIGSVGAHSALRVDAAGKVHIVYDDATNGMLRYARSP